MSNTLHSNELHLRIEQNGLVKIGTCAHCVLEEEGRPDRAWNPDGDKELDFNRDQLLEDLKNLGVTTEITQEYVCP